VHYIARVGLDYCKRRVLEDDEGRSALFARLQDALRDEPDPWHQPEQARVDLRQFQPIPLVLEEASHVD
jgi:nitrite reductase (NADH) large subunit